jgi:hypothetical protein
VCSNEPKSGSASSGSDDFEDDFERLRESLLAIGENSMRIKRSLKYCHQYKRRLNNS